MNQNQKLNYPVTLQSDTVDNYHGTLLADPYRWLEDLESEATKNWVEAENEVTFSYLQQIPIRKNIQDKLTQLWDYEKYSIPWREGDRYFYFKNDGLQNQSVLYTLTYLDGGSEVLLDPNQLSQDGTIALSGISISDNGKYLAYGLSTAGSDWQKWQIKDIETKEDLPDTLDWIKFSGAAWTIDNRGFFYSRYDEPVEGNEFAEINYYQKLYYHQLGTPQSADRLIYHRLDEKEWGFSGSVTDDGRYLIISVWRGSASENLVFYQDLSQPNGQVIELINEFVANYSFIDNEGSLFWFLTDLDAPKRKVVAIDVNERSGFQDVIAESEETLNGVNILHRRFIASYLKDARSQVKIYDLDGQFIREIELPGIGSVGGFGGKKDDTETFYSFTSFTSPNTIYRYNLLSSESTLFRQSQVDFQPQDYEVKQVFYSSKDGTQIPMFITHERGLVLDGNNPTLLYGYGGFNVSLTPSFSVSLLVWMEMGGVYAVPNLRGGGEYGEEWHQAGTKAKKQNVFDDFISAAEWLIANGYTSTSKLAISGGSNGGLLVGACMTQRPDLFAAALPAVGVMDMLRFHKFTIGWAWTSEYGCADNSEEFSILQAYSPLHNLKDGTAYPATLITTAERDDRVVPAHSFKFAAALQAAHQGETPVLIRIETKAGHGAGKPTAKLIEETADKWAFLMVNLNK
jgi:prolyl oligopeptidase